MFFAFQAFCGHATLEPPLGVGYCILGRSVSKANVSLNIKFVMWGSPSIEYYFYYVVMGVVPFRCYWDASNSGTWEPVSASGAYGHWPWPRTLVFLFGFRVSSALPVVPLCLLSLAF